MNARSDPSSTLDDQLDALAGDFHAPDEVTESSPTDADANPSDADEDRDTPPEAGPTEPAASTAQPAAAMNADADPEPNPDPEAETEAETNDPAEIPGDFQAPGEVDEDLTGEAFAAQVQAMLDEADLLTEDDPPADPDAPTMDTPTGDTPPEADAEPNELEAAAPADDPAEAVHESADAAPSPTPTADQADAASDDVADADPDATDDDDAGADDLMSQIDDMLADAAGDTLGGEFESLETIEGLDDDADAPDEVNDDLPPHPDVLTGKADPESVAPRADAADATDADADPDEATDDEAADEDDPEQNEAMNRLAEELDEAESEAFAARMQGQAVLDPDDPEPPPDEEQAAEAAAAAAKQPKTPAKPRRKPREVVLTTLARLNTPINRLSPDLRAAVGLLALGNLFFGLGLLLIAALFG